MFRDPSDGIEEYTTSVTGFINKYINDVVPTLNVGTYPNQKPWITGKIRTELKELPLTRSRTLTRTLVRTPAMPSDEPSNRQRVNTELRLNPTTPAQVAGLANYYGQQREDNCVVEIYCIYQIMRANHTQVRVSYHKVNI
jgi:hypothetical protein